MISFVFNCTESLEVFSRLKVPTSSENQNYQIGGTGEIINGEPSFPFNSILFIRKEGIVWAQGNFYGKQDLSNLVTEEDIAPFISQSSNSVQKGSLATINGQDLENGGNIFLDLSLIKIVEILPTENILDNKIYMVPDVSNNETNFKEYIWTGTQWNQLGVYKTTLDLSGYLTKNDADKKYMTKSASSSSSNSQLSISSSGAFNNYGNNGQAFNAVRDFTNEPNNTKWNSSLGSGYKIDAASFGVKDNGTTAFSHKKYDSFNKETGAYTGAKNTAVLVFSGRTGLMYAKNTGSANDVTDDMYKYVGVIDSPDEKQKVYSASQIDSSLSALQNKIEELEKINSELISKLNSLLPDEDKIG